jgi:hypothetical protein
MTEHELVSLWVRARWHIIISQLGPIFLLIVTVGFLAAGLPSAPLTVRVAAAGILLASGTLGALTQIASANEGLAVIDDLLVLENPSSLTTRIIASAPWVDVVRFATPTIFVFIYAAIIWALFF